MMIDIHVLSVLCGTVVIIVLGRVFIAFRDRQSRDSKEIKKL